MRKSTARAFLVIALTLLGVSAQAADVRLASYLYGTGSPVALTSPVGAYNGSAGALVGTLSGAPGFDATPFITYSVEIDDSLRFSRSAVSGYALVDGGSYFQARRGDATIADALARLLSYASDNAGLVANASGSASLQLAIWNTIYDTDFTVSSLSTFNDTSASAGLANGLLAGAQGVTSDHYHVYVLERAGNQDLLVLGAFIPEPGSLWLVLAALLPLPLLSRQRRRSIDAATAPSTTKIARL